MVILNSYVKLPEAISNGENDEMMNHGMERGYLQYPGYPTGYPLQQKTWKRLEKPSFQLGRSDCCALIALLQTKYI